MRWRAICFPAGIVGRISADPFLFYPRPQARPVYVCVEFRRTSALLMSDFEFGAEPHKSLASPRRLLSAGCYLLRPAFSCRSPDVSLARGSKAFGPDSARAV